MTEKQILEVLSLKGKNDRLRKALENILDYIERERNGYPFSPEEYYARRDAARSTLLKEKR